MRSDEAAEFLRTFARVGTSLFECLRVARADGRYPERVEQAAEALGMP